MPAARGVKRSASKSSSATTSSSAKNKKKRAAPFQLEIPTLPTKKACVLTCGQGDVGQLGLGEDVLEATKFKYVSALGDKIVAACAGGMHTIALDSDGKVWTFGCNDEGALGRPTSSETDEGTPTSVALPSKAVAISAGDSHSAALLEDGLVYAWGSFRDSHGSMGLIARGRTGKACREPVCVALPDTAAGIASGGDHLVMLTTTGAVYTMGCGEQGQLGRLSQRSATRDARQGFSALLTPMKVSLKGPASRVWAGYHGTFAQGSAGLYVWGLNNYGQLGIGASPAQSLVFLPSHWVAMSPRAVSPGQHHTLLVADDGRLHALGRRDYGRLGLGEQCSDATELTLVPKLADQRCVSVAAGTSSSFAVTDNGTLYSWGMGSEGLLGVGGVSDLWEPTVAPSTLKARAVAAGGQHTVLLAEDPSKPKPPSPEPEKDKPVQKTEDKKVKDKKQDDKDKAKGTKRQRTASKTDNEVSSTTTAEGDRPEKKQKINGKDKKETPMEVDETDSKQLESIDEAKEQEKETEKKETDSKEDPEPMDTEPIPDTDGKEKEKQTTDEKEGKPTETTDKTEPADKEKSAEKPKTVDEATDKIEAKTIDTEMKEAKPEMNGAAEEPTDKADKMAEVTEKVVEKEEKLEKTDATLPPATATA